MYLDLEEGFDIELDLDGIDLGEELDYDRDDYMEIELSYGEDKNLVMLITTDFNIAKDFNKDLREKFDEKEKYYLIPEGEEIVNHKLLSKFSNKDIVKLTIEEADLYKDNSFQREFIKNHLIYIDTES